MIFLEGFFCLGYLDDFVIVVRDKHCDYTSGRSEALNIEGNISCIEKGLSERKEHEKDLDSYAQ